MAIYSVIDITASGDTPYEGFEKDVANWALTETQITNLKVGTTAQILVGGGATVTPVWTTATGTGAPVRATSPTLVTPTLGVATVTSVNKVALTAPATSATIALADGKTFTCSNTVTVTATDSAVVACEAGGTVTYLTTAQTLTNKRVTERVTTVASGATPTPAGDDSDIFTVTALAEAATFGAPTGTPTNGQKLIIRIKDNATARTLSWNAIYRAGDIPLPTTTVISKTIYLGFIYNSADSKWDLVGLVQRF